jgi:hypothetical protein
MQNGLRAGSRYLVSRVDPFALPATYNPSQFEPAFAFGFGGQAALQ